ncbi:hypothetical protein [Bacillus sp. Marseille-Q1617]|uniref:hypothetical protein n=1 Tax=Bacillus sp. Marseille-Q1617 TaxID=2736887 RepID=UPI00158E7BD2|nr:hypothetical protein [Bacillus sp. Marseille-Q1617]
MSFLKETLSQWKRRLQAFLLRFRAALYYTSKPFSNHSTNGDEERYRNKIANFSKGLPHNELGEVDLNAYKKYIEILKSGDSDKFENLPLAGERKLVNPQAAYSFEMVGPDSHQLVTSPPPSFSSAEVAAEMVELYWQALTRDVSFNDYDSNHLTIAAANELSSLLDFNGPKVDGK